MKNIIIVGLFGLIFLSGCGEKPVKETPPASVAEQPLAGNMYKLGDTLMDRDNAEKYTITQKFEAIYISATSGSKMYLKHQYKRDFGGHMGWIYTAVTYPLLPGESIQIMSETGGTPTNIRYIQPSVEKPDHFEIEITKT